VSATLVASWNKFQAFKLFLARSAVEKSEKKNNPSFKDLAAISFFN